MRIKILFITLFICSFSWGQTNVIAGTAYTENFNALGASATAALPANWKAQKTTTARDAAFSYAAGVTAVELAGGNNMATNAANGIYRFNANNATNESALGGLSSNTASKTVVFMSYFNNNGPTVINNFTISYDVEKYRNGSNVNGFTMDLFYSTDGLTWTACGGSFILSFSADADNAGYVTAPDITVNNSGTYTPATPVAVNGKFYFAWRYSVTATSTSSNAQALGFDNVSITPKTVCPATVAGSITSPSSTCGTTVLHYTGADAANCYWQTSSTGTTMGPGNIATTDLTTSTSGTYYVRNFNGTCWSNTYTASTITVNNNPSITASPSNTTILAGANASFFVSVANPGVYQWQVSTDGGLNFTPIANGGVYSNATTATLTITGAPSTMNGYIYNCVASPYFPCSIAVVSGNTILTVTSTVSSASDLVAVAGSEAAAVPSTINNVTIATSSDGIKVWEFTVRDGGGTADADSYATILTAFNIAQAATDGVGSWTDAIYSIGLFDGTTFIANGTVTANQIQFSGLNVVVADGTNKTLTLRLSLKCPLLTTAVDGDDFGFSISAANTTFSASGSGKSAFAAITNPNTTNVIQVVATKLVFTTQPVTTGQNSPMTTVVVKATDACGNIDLGFTGTISLTSTGTMTAVTPVAAIAGVASFTTIVHTVTGTSLTLSATASGLTAGTSSAFDIVGTISLQAGDIAILAFNTDNLGAGTGSDEVSFVTFVDIVPGTIIDMTDNAYQKCGTLNGWGISEGWIRIERANTTLPKGTIVTVRVAPSGGAPSVFSPDPSNWICTKPQPAGQGNFDLNNGGEQIFFLTGGAVGGPGVNTATIDSGTYSGSFLYGFNTKGNIWTPVCGNAAAGGTKNSDKPLNFDCFLTWPTAQADLNKYTGPMTPATQRDWVARIGDPTNWTGYLDNPTYDAGPNFYGGTITISTGGYSAGVWIGDKDSNWFECSNWQSRKVPDATVNVTVGSSAMQGVTVDATATNANFYNFIAQCKDLAITNYNVKVEGSASNILEVYGNLSLSGTGVIDMDDNNAATADGRINLYGNWTNSAGSAAFCEGNSTVNFTGTGTQVISNVTPVGTETFYDVILNNNFNTGLSNDLIASNNLTINAGKTLTIDAAGYARVNNKLSNNGSVLIDSDVAGTGAGQLIQVNNTDTNDGVYTGTNFQVKRTALAKNTDYVYWSSPLSTYSVSGLPNAYRYLWNTTYTNSNGTQGNWNTASGNMTPGKGYIARAENGSTAAIALPITFSGSKPNNGTLALGVSRGNYTGADYDADPSTLLNVDTTKCDDNWNLVGNPYPSAIDAESFLVLNQSVIDGSVWIWKHGLVPNATMNPFYQNFANNYSTADYIKYNGLGSTDPDTFAGKIGTGQGFMVSMKDVGTFASAGANPNLDVYTSTISFNNSLRSDSSTNPYMPYNNTDFYKSAPVNDPPVTQEKHRIWLDISNNTTHETDRMLVGYATNATMGRDNLYDCFFVPRSISLYSLLGEDSLIIQGRALPFDINDQVPLGIHITEAGSHTIAINKVDGLFLNDTNIYLEDKQLQLIYDLKQAPYVFTAEEGKFNNRFVLRYTNETLGNSSFTSLDNSVIVTTNSGTMAIESYLENLQEVTVFDVLGRTLLSAKNIGNNEFKTQNLASATQTLIIKIKLVSGTIVTRKIIM